MSPEPIGLNDPHVIHLTDILQQLTTMLSMGGFQSELREPYREYGLEIPGRDLKITHPDAPAYYAAVKATVQRGATRLVAYSATFSLPGYAKQAWSVEDDREPVYGHVVQFITKHYSDFRRDELQHRRSPA
jgi:hypothetical protein